MQKEKRITAPSGKTYILAAWPALTALSRGIKILNQIGPLSVPLVSSFNEDGTLKSNNSTIQNFISPALWRSLDADILIDVVKELCEGIVFAETGQKLDIENHFNDYQEDLFFVISQSAIYQLSPFFKAGLLNDLNLRVAEPAGR